MSLLSKEFQLYDLAADLILEISSYLCVHDQANMKRICQWWTRNLSDTYLSRSVEVDGSRMTNLSANLLEHSLNMCVQKNTRILIVRQMAFKARSKQFGIITRMIKQKKADLILLILKDCSVDEDFAGIAYFWLNPQHLTDYMLQCLIFATKKLILVNYTMWNALGGVFLSWLDSDMPRVNSRPKRRNVLKKLPVVLPRHEFDCTKSSVQHYHGFVMALNFNCPEVSPEVRNDIVQLYNSCIHSDTPEYQLESLGFLIKGLNEGVPRDLYSDNFHLDIPALRRLDPLTLNKLTMEALHRMYF